MSVPVVAIGASAGGLEAIVELLGALSPKTAMAYVIVLHLDPEHPGAAAIRSAMSEAGLRLYITKYELPYRLFVDAMPASHREFFAGLALYHETPDCICTHAGIDPAVHVLADQPPRALVWGVASFPAEYDGDTPVVYGHRNDATAGADGWPMPNVVGNTIGVDTISHGVLTALRLPDRTVFQSDGTKTRSVVL